jgi:hypothetical protein
VRVASIACAGPYASLTEAAGLLSAGIADRGLIATGEYEEWYLHYEGDSSPNTITWVLNPLR